MVAEILRTWQARLQKQGFDLLQAFGTGDYNRSPLALGNEFRLPDFERTSAQAIVIAHSRALWHSFIATLNSSKDLRHSPHPLDCYTERCVKDLQLGTKVTSLAFYSHQRDPAIPIQRVAHVAGLAELSPSHLSVHPRVGPWLGLRAVVVFDLPSATTGSSGREGLCHPCSKPCLQALQAATKSALGEPGEHWRSWLRVRESCPIGQRERYTQNQIRYHYTKDRSALRR